MAKRFLIRTGFLTGNLGDGCEEYAENYAAALSAAIQNSYPDASVTVRYEDGEGLRSWTLKPLVCGLDGVVRPEDAQEFAEIEEHVNQMAQTVWATGSWVPDNTGD